MCECPPRGQVVQTNRAAVRRAPGHREEIAATAGRRPSVWGIVDESTSLRRRRARRDARGRGLDSVRAHRTAAAAPRRARSPSGCRSTRSRAGRTSWPRPTRQFQAKHPGHERRRPVPDLGRPPEQVRRHARGRQHAGRHRDGEHRDDEVHGGGRVREPDARRRARSRTRRTGSRASPRPAIYNGKTYGVPYYAGSRVVTYRTDLFKKAHAKVPTSLAAFTATAKKLAQAEQQEGLLAGLHRGHRLVLRDELRLRLRRPDRRRCKRQVGRPARVAEVDRRPDRVQELLQRRLAGEQDRRPRTGRSRTTSTRRARRPRSSARPGSAAASARSTRT